MARRLRGRGWWWTSSVAEQSLPGNAASSYYHIWDYSTLVVYATRHFVFLSDDPQVSQEGYDTDKSHGSVWILVAVRQLQYVSYISRSVWARKWYQSHQASGFGWQQKGFLGANNQTHLYRRVH